MPAVMNVTATIFAQRCIAQFPYEGGATYQKGVWRPARSCAMNSAGNTGGYCPVCRAKTPRLTIAG